MIKENDTECKDIKGNEGYGWGVWLIPENDELLNNTLNHQPHITITCNMEKEYAYEFFETLKLVYGEKFRLLFDSHCTMFIGGGYNDNDPYNFCSGYLCSSTIWDKFKKMFDKYKESNPELKNKGNFSKNPHLTYSYAKKTQDIKYTNCGNTREIVCKLVVADIRASEPSEWRIF